MGWNTNLIVARDRTLEQVMALIPDVYTAGDEEISFESAASPELKPAIAVGQVENCVLLWDPVGKLADNHGDFLTHLSRVHPAIVMSLSSVEGRYAFHVHDFGRTRVRRVWQGADVVESEGAHPGMSFDAPKMASWGCDEDYLFALAEQLGAPSPGACENARYRVCDFG